MVTSAAASTATSKARVERFKDPGSATSRATSASYRAMVARYGTYFRWCHGRCRHPEAPGDLRPEAEVAALRQTIASDSGPRKARAIKRLKVINAFVATGNSPASMVLTKIPVIPLPDGSAGRRPLRDLRPQRPVPSRHQPQHPTQASARAGALRSSSMRSACFRSPLTPSSINGRRGCPVAGPASGARKTT